MDTVTQPVPVNIEDEMRQSYMDYAMSVIVGRALPDVRDGLKPVQRRVLYAMLGEGLTSDKKTSKCAGVVGEVLKRLHPHGDISVYDALVRLAQPWNLRYPLVDGQGNFGSIDGDAPAAYRYTECRMTALAEKLLQDLDKETVDFIPNFDDSNIEPVVLPTVVPNLLLNGADGIAVGMATKIPPHNLTEVCNAAIAVIENPAISIAELMKIIPGPDFPTGGIIHGRAPIVSAYATGKGLLQIRAKTTIEPIKGKKEGEAIVVTEIPYQVNKARLVEKIAELINSKQIEGISKLRDESDKSGMRIVMEIKRDATTDVVMNQLFKLTPMQTSFGVINLAIVEGKPVVCPLVDLLKHFLDHRRDVVTRRTQFELRKARERMHLLEGFRIVLLNLDEVIQLIKKSDTPKEAKEGLQARWELSPIQAQAILDMRLQKLTGLERLAVEKEHQELAAEISRLNAILADAKQVDGIITGELKELIERFGDERRTRIEEERVGEVSIAELIEEEDMVVTVSHQGYIKRTPASSYRVQKRGGKGIYGASQKDEDFVEHLYVTSTHADLVLFTTRGRTYSQKVYDLPEASRQARGRALVNLFKVRDEAEKMTAILPVREFVENRFVFMATKNGIVKKTDLMEFSNIRSSGIVGCLLRENDQLIGAALTDGTDDVILATKNGMSIRFHEDDVRSMGRSATGVRGIRLEEGDEVVSMTVVPRAEETPMEGANGEAKLCGITLLSACRNGYGKRTAVEDYRVQGRGGVGIIDIKADDRNGPVVGVAAVSEKSGLMIITSGGKIIRIQAAEIRVQGRNTLGVKLVNLEEGEKIAAIAHIQEEDEE